tara:strand:+ start:31924 stop:32850 length:927 start_codon:yes stop_codon:yes gene_type:complete
MKLVLFAYRTVGYECVKYLNDNSIEQLVVIPSDDLGKDHIFKSVKKIVLKRKIPFIQIDSMNDSIVYNKLNDFKANASFSCYFPKIIPKEILSIFKFGSLNLHGALLPEYMGTFSGVWSIINDEKISGSTLHYMESKVDTGNIVERKTVYIDNNDTGQTLYNKVSLKSIDLFKKYCLLLANGSEIISYPQDFNKANYYKRKVPHDGVIKWEWDSRKIYNFCRALNFPPFKSAETCLSNQKFEIVACDEIITDKINSIPGKVLSISNDGIVVSCRKNNIIILEIRKNNSFITSFDNSFIKVGDILGNNL